MSNLNTEATMKKIETHSGFPVKGYLKYLLRLAISVAIVLVPMAVPRIFFGKILFTYGGTILYIGLSFLLAVIVSAFSGDGANDIEYGHYKRTALIWVYILTTLIVAVILIILAILFLKNMFTSVSNDEQRNMRRLAEFNVMLFLSPFIVTFSVTVGALSGVFSNSCSSCKILDTIVPEGSDVLSSELKRHTHKEKGHYETDYAYVEKPLAWSNELPEYVIKHKRWVEGKEVDDGLFEHKTIQHHMKCTNCGRRFNRTSKSETKINN